ncbi:hypothetical protein HanIR_Chr17g0891201 [Helianthus annuus]|nr:hypothetical protein HanIR_Chr17g0891201 [Helianthus annuus]
MTLYVDFFWEGNFRLPMSKFIGELLTGYGLHISQINTLGLPQITHFEFICRAQRIEPTFEKFNVFYFVTYTGGFYSFNSRTTGVLPCSRDPPKSLHDWKQKFFYIRRGVIPIDMHYRSESEGVPRVAVSIAFADEDWYKTLSRRATLMIQLEERAPVAAGMSMLWVPRDPRAYLDYAHKGRAGYSLMNVFDSKVAGGMTVAALPEGEPGWVSRIRYNFLHPSNESIATYANVILGDDEDESDVDVVPTREELILLSSRRGPTQEPAGKGVSTPPVVDPTVAAAGQKETRTKKREETKTEGEKTAEEPAISPIRKRSSNVPLLDYVVVSDSLSGLDAGVKWSAPDPDDDVTLTELLAKKQKVLEEKKRELDAQAAAVLSEKILKFMGETVAPSESEVDLGVFTKKSGRLLTLRKKGLLWRVADSEDKLAKEKQFNANRQKDWEAACEISNRDLKSARDEVVKLKAEKAKDSQEYERLAVAHKEKEAESQTRIVALEKTVEEQSTQNKALELLADDLGADCKWLLARGIPLIADRLVKSDELAKYMFELGGAAYDNGRKDGYGEGKVAALAKDKDYQFELYKVDCIANYTAKRQEYEFLECVIIKAIEKLTRKGIVVETLKKVLEDTDAETGGAGPSQPSLIVLFFRLACRVLVYRPCNSRQFDACSMFVNNMSYSLCCVLRMNGGYDRLLCLINPAVHLIVTSLGGLQCLFYHYANALFTYA